MDDGLGKGFYFKMVAAIIGIGIAGLIGFLLFDRWVYRYGFIGAFAIAAGILLFIAWMYDRRHARPYDE
jgi:hypothetical protein